MGCFPIVSGQIDAFLAQVDAKFAGQTPPNGLNDDDPRRLTLGFSQSTGSLVDWTGNLLPNTSKLSSKIVHVQSKKYLRQKMFEVRN